MSNENEQNGCDTQAPAPYTKPYIPRWFGNYLDEYHRALTNLRGEGYIGLHALLSLANRQRPDETTFISYADALDALTVADVLYMMEFSKPAPSDRKVDARAVHKEDRKELAARLKLWKAAILESCFDRMDLHTPKQVTQRIVNSMRADALGFFGLGPKRYSSYDTTMAVAVQSIAHADMLNEPLNTLHPMRGYMIVEGTIVSPAYSVAEMLQGMLPNQIMRTLLTGYLRGRSLAEYKLKWVKDTSHSVS